MAEYFSPKKDLIMCFTCNGGVLFPKERFDYVFYM